MLATQTRRNFRRQTPKSLALCVYDYTSHVELILFLHCMFSFYPAWLWGIPKKVANCNDGLRLLQGGIQAN